MAKNSTVMALLPLGPGPLADWLDENGYGAAAETIRNEIRNWRYTDAFVFLPRGDLRLAAFLEESGHRTAADIVRRGY